LESGSVKTWFQKCTGNKLNFFYIYCISGWISSHRYVSCVKFGS
jgi:hypothetical protein